MMKKNFSLIFSLALAALVLGGVLPAVASEEGGKITPVAKGICLKINNLFDTIGQRMINSGAKLEGKKAENNAAWVERQVNRDKNKAEKRANWVEKRDAQLSKLEKHASSTAEKEAVIAFKTTMTAAIAARQAAVDKAISDYRLAMKGKMSARQSALDTAIAAYKTAQQAAFDKAKADCASDINSKTVNNALKAALKAAQNKFKADRRAIEKIGPGVNELNDIKKAAIEKAVSDFKTVAEQARTALKTAFGIK